MRGFLLLVQIDLPGLTAVCSGAVFLTMLTLVVHLSCRSARRALCIEFFVVKTINIMGVYYRNAIVPYTSNSPQLDIGYDVHYEIDRQTMA